MFRPTQKEALRSLAPTVSYTSQPNGDGTFTILQWDLHSVGVAQPTTEEINTELTRLQTEYDAQDYARKRKAEYPSIEELVVGLYDTDDKSAIETKRAEVKAKYPK